MYKAFVIVLFAISREKRKKFASLRCTYECLNKTSSVYLLRAINFQNSWEYILHSDKMNFITYSINYDLIYHLLYYRQIPTTNPPALTPALSSRHSPAKFPLYPKNRQPIKICSNNPRFRKFRRAMKKLLQRSTRDVKTLQANETTR